MDNIDPFHYQEPKPENKYPGSEEFYYPDKAEILKIGFINDKGEFEGFHFGPCKVGNQYEQDENGNYYLAKVAGYTQEELKQIIIEHEKAKILQVGEIVFNAEYNEYVLYGNWEWNVEGRRVKLKSIRDGKLLFMGYTIEELQALVDQKHKK